jgi:hypothetical protein
VTFNKTQHEVEELLKSIVRLLLNIPETDNTSIRIPYGASSNTGSAPAHVAKNGVCYIYVSPTDDGYGQQHHIRYTNGKTEEDGMTEVDEYTEEYSVTFSCYGPDSHDRARSIRDGFYSNAVHRILDKEKFYLKSGVPAIAQTHETIKTEWVKRNDVTLIFYAYVRIERENAVQPIEKVDISMKSQVNYFIYRE